MSWKYIGRPLSPVPPVPCPHFSSPCGQILCFRPIHLKLCMWLWSSFCWRVGINEMVELPSGSDTIKAMRFDFSCGILIGKTLSGFTCPWLFLVSQGFHYLSFLDLEHSFSEIKPYFTNPFFFLCRMGSWDSRWDASFASWLRLALGRSPGMIYLRVIFLHSGSHPVCSRNIDCLLLWRTLNEGLMDRHFLLTLRLFSLLWKLKTRWKGQVTCFGE